MLFHYRLKILKVKLECFSENILKQLLDYLANNIRLQKKVIKYLLYRIENFMESNSVENFIFNKITGLLNKNESYFKLLKY